MTRSLAVVLRVSLALGLVCAQTRRTAAAEQWVMAKSPHFLVASDAGERPARLVAHQFEQIRGLFQDVLKSRVDSGQSFVILATRDEEGLKHLLPGYWERKGGARPAGVFVGRDDKNYVALRLDVVGPNRYHVIYHEYVHYLCNLSYARLPVWLSEGLAEFYGATEIDDEAIRFGLMQGRHVELLRTGYMLPVKELIAADRGSPHYNEATRVSIFYAESAALTHFLLTDEQRRGQLVEYLRLLKEGNDDAEAFGRVFGPPEALEKDLFKYVRRLVFQGRIAKVSLDAQKIEARALSEAEAGALQGDFLIRTGRRREGRERLEAVLRLEPSLPLANQAMGMLELGEGRSREASRWFARALELTPDDCLSQYYSALSANEGVDAEAEFLRRERALARAIELNTSFSPAFERLADLYREAGRNLESARRIAIRACSLEPAKLRYRVTLLRVMQKAGAQDEAAALEKEIVAKAASDPAALSELVSSYEEQGRPEAAEGLLVKAAAQRPSSASIHSALAYHLMGKERHDEAEVEFRKVLQLRPKDAETLNTLGYMNADRGVHVEEALGMIDQALKVAPQSAHILDSRGWALYRLKRLEEAEKTLRRAIELGPSPVLLDHLGDVLRGRGRLAEAIPLWRRARDDEQASDKLHAAIVAKLAVAEGTVR